MNPIMVSTYFDILGKAQKIYARHLEPVCRKWDLTRSELDVLLFLYNNPQYDRATDIVTLRGMTKSHVSLSVTSLADRGLLNRKFFPADRRTAHLALTERGLLIAREAREHQEQFFGQLYTDVDPEDYLRMQEIMKKIRANIENLDNSLTNT